MIVLQTLLVIGFAGALLLQTRSFGSMPECNGTIVVVLLFFPIHKLHVALPLLIALTILLGGIFIILLICDYRNMIRKHLSRVSVFRSPLRCEADLASDSVRLVERSDYMPTACIMIGFPLLWAYTLSKQPPTIIGDPYNMGQVRFSSSPSRAVQWSRVQVQTRTRKDIHRTTDNGGYWGLLIGKLLLIVIIETLLIANLEQLILKNRFQGSDTENEWGFGQVWNNKPGTPQNTKVRLLLQILPLMLITLPLLDVVRMYHKYGLHPRPHHPSSRKRFSYHWVFIRTRCTSRIFNV